MVSRRRQTEVELGKRYCRVEAESSPGFCGRDEWTRGVLRRMLRIVYCLANPCSSYRKQVGWSVTDPNWLLATMAQSAAALVAIIGGFLVSRVITLSTERRGLDRRLREIWESAADKRNLLSEARQSRREVSWHVFVDLAVEDCARERGRSAPELLADDYWIRGVSDFDEMVEMATRLNTIMRQACQRIEHIQSTRPTPPPIPEHLKNPLINLTGESPSSRQRPIIAEQLEVPRGEEEIYQAALDELVPLERSVLTAYDPVSGDLGGESVDTSDYADLIAAERKMSLEVSVLEREEGFYSSELARVVMAIIEIPQSRSSKFPTLGSVILGWLVSFRSVFSGLGLV